MRPATVLALTPNIGGFYFGEVLQSLRREIDAAGGRLLVVQTVPRNTREDGVELSDFDRPVAWDQVDGVVSVTTAAGPDYLHRLQQVGKPVVLVSTRIPGLDAPVALPDNNGGMRTAVAHLIAHGHSRIGFIGHVGQSDVDQRREGYRAALADAGLTADPADLFAVDDADWTGGEEAGRQILARGADRPTAFAVATDRNADGMMRVLAAAGVRVPQDVAVVGFDNLDASAFSEPPLTTVDQRFAEVGTAAARLLLTHLDPNGFESFAATPPVGELVTRRSCGCPPATGADESVGVDAWRRRAGHFLHEVDSTQAALAEQYRVDASMLARTEDPRHLTWLAGTHVSAAVFATWAPDPADGLVIAGVHGVDSAVVGTATTTERFPPAALLDAPTGSEQTVIVVPVADAQRDWGLLALVGHIDTSSTLETYRHWAAQLCASLHERALQAAVRASEQRYALAARATNDGLWERDLITGGFYLSDRCVELAGLPGGDPEAREYDRWLSRVHPDDDEYMRETIRSSIDTDGTVTAEYRLRQADGSYRWVLARAFTERRPDGTPARIVGSLTDIHARRLLEERLRASALHDEVTGLPNRRLFVQRLDSARTRCDRDGTAFSVVFLDLDRFKAINDSLGHLIGDQLLVTVAHRLTDTVRAVDTVARFGGDEFAILLEGIGRGEVLGVLERLRRTLAEPITLDDHDLVVTASFGVATDDAGHACAEDVLRDADTAMYHAKSAERGSVMFFDAAMHAEALHRLRMTGELRRALADGEFEVHYQPIVELPSGSGTRFEALVRWRHPDRGLITPDQFLPLMIETGLIVPLGQWLVDDVCRQLAEWGPLVSNVAVNLSDREFWHGDLLSLVLGSVRRHGITPDRLTLEITEGVIMNQPESALGIMTALHDAGFALHIDDFGTGYSSLDSLHRFPVDALKVDRSFVSGVGAAHHSEALIRAIVAMAAALHLEVVAEGVETEEQVAFLRQVGCAMAQGWHFGRPMAVSEATEWLPGPVEFLRRPA